MRRDARPWSHLLLAVRQGAEGADEGVNTGPCSECGGELAPEQPYCLNCGPRVGPPLALPYLIPPEEQASAAAAPAAAGSPWRLPIGLPMPAHMATTFAA